MNFRLFFTLFFINISVLLFARIPYEKYTYKFSEPIPKLSDKEFKFLFMDAQDLFNYEYYDESLKIFQNLLATDINNCNLNFYVGACYLNLKKQKTKSIQYLEKAVKKTDIAYSYNYKETSAPVFAYLYLGQAYHLAGRFDEALTNYEKFKSFLTNKNKDGNFLNEVNRCIDITKYAKKLITKPIKIKIEPFKTSNSTYSDYAPALSIDGTKLYFSSKRKGNMGGQKDNFGEFYDDIYYTQFKGNKWIKPKKVGSKINTGAGEVLNCISSDGKQFYFSRLVRETFDIFVSELSKKGKWQPPHKLGPGVNTKDNELYAFITTDGNTLLFSSDKTGGYGGYDIYMSEKLSTGEWAQPFNLGSDVNSEYDEICPMLMPDGTLYFSSKGHKTIGGFDIFMTTISEEGLWTKPENMGYPLNTVYDDTNFIYTSSDEKKGFYSSAKTGGYGEADIYQFSREK